MIQTFKLAYVNEGRPMRTDGFDIFGASDVGKKRSENQDHFLVADLRRQLTVRQTDIPEKQNAELFGCQEGSLLVVADGMGGHHGGEQASQTAVEASAKYVLDMMHWFLKLSADDEQEFLDELSDCLKSVQKKIWAAGESDGRRMGTTVTMAYLLWPRMFVVHAGDSRCYLLRDGHLQQLTTDHTIAQKLIDSGGMSPDDDALKNWRHVLWNCVGGGDQQVRPEAVRCQLQHDDVLLLCSDGLTGMLDDEMIGSIISSADSSEQAGRRLIDEANRAGGKDNISVIVCRIEQPNDCDDDQSVGAFDTTIG
ncbi:PP2C family protein-serine/threonine phosphatase [Aporhodopirellula aestuarii]|uniref:Protein phosphatase 2C domain-containing protein n=1 Tax=Aporhodopirellula aestuarii TaxID=2950107 RepID=A0ABT0U7F6_9BACT|nr:protein phosphatase 2C domain-containing protein [Aporhodopirellula aestuarii]MCM2372847.1 protein phosphatase 2C domain-containing protein [Aporhodopirellula aestuarii]